MNKTKIDWADMTWNPVTGCLNECDYCYARKIARRFSPEWNLTYVGGVKPPHLSGVPYPYGFMPTLHPDRLQEPASIKKPQRIFVCSMADLFGDWVQDEWIQKVFKACQSAPQHKYMFLTKNPGRYAQIKRSGFLPEGSNYWYGATFDHSNWADKKGGHDPGDFYFPDIGDRNRFISFEPLTMDFNIGSTGAKWHIIGAETGNRKNKVVPKPEWVQHIVDYSRVYGASVFMKDSLRKLMGADFIQELPEGLK